MPFTPDQVKMLLDEFYMVDPKYERLMFEFLTRFANSPSREYAHHGFRRFVSFNNRHFRKSLDKNFVKVLIKFRPWFHHYLEDFRHALAHRIPLYIPPYTVRPNDHARYQELEILKSEAISEKKFEKYLELDAEQDSLGVSVQ